MAKFDSRKACLIGRMELKSITKGRGRPSKGPRHSFTVKLDMRRAEKLVQILERLGTNGISYLTPIIEAHVDAIDLYRLREQPRRGQAGAVESSATSSTGTL